VAIFIGFRSWSPIDRASSVNALSPVLTRHCEVEAAAAGADPGERATESERLLLQVEQDQVVLQLEPAEHDSRRAGHGRRGRRHLEEREAHGAVVHLHERGAAGNQPRMAVVEEQVDVGDGEAKAAVNERGGRVAPLEGLRGRRARDAAGGRVERPEQRAVHVGAQRGVGRHGAEHHAARAGAGVEVERAGRQRHGLVVDVDVGDAEVVGSVPGVPEQGELVPADICGHLHGRVPSGARTGRRRRWPRRFRRRPGGSTTRTPCAL
jgi:hypothetical protein